MTITDEGHKEYWHTCRYCDTPVGMSHKPERYMFCGEDCYNKSFTVIELGESTPERVREIINRMKQKDESTNQPTNQQSRVK